MKTLSLIIPKIFIINGRLNLISFLKKYDSKQVLFIITPTVQKNISFIPTQGNISTGFSFLIEDLDKKVSELQNISKIVVIGASKILDQAKYLAYKLNIPLIAVPSILSTNAFSTEKSVLKVDGKATSVDAKVPNEVYIVDSLLEMAPQKYHRFGLIDVLSIYTATQDWDIAIKNKKATLAVEYFLAKSILEAFLHISTKLEINYYDTTKLLLHSGLVVSMHGDGRPESGSEHIIAKIIESKINCFHAYSVSFGILMAMKLQNSWRKDVALLARNIPDWKSDYGKNILTQIEGNLLSEDVKLKSGRYTVLDETTSLKIDIAIKKTINFLK